MPLPEFLDNGPAPHAPTVTKEPATMVGTDGKMYTVPGSSIAKALQNGWRHASDEEVAHSDAVKARVQEEEEHPIREGLMRFSNKALFDIPQTILEHNQTPEQNAIDKEAEEKIAEQHPFRTGIEKAAGFLAPLLVPGVGEAGDAVEGLVGGGTKLAEQGAAEAAAQSLGRKVAASAAKYATEGALYSSPQAAVQLAYGDPEQAAETMLWGVGLSGALGAGGALLGAGAKAVAEKGQTAIGALSEGLSKPGENGLSQLDDVARNVLGISDKQAQKLGAGRLGRLVERADQEGLLGAAPKARAGMIESILEDAGQKISDHQSKLEELLSDPEIRQHGPVPLNTAAKFQEEIAKMPELSYESHSAEAKYAQSLYNDIARGGADPSFSKLQEVREAIKKSGKAFMADSPAAKLGRLADNIIKKDLEESAQKIYSAGNLPDKFADYLSQKERYWMASQLADSAALNPFKGTGRVPFLGQSAGLGATANIGFGLLSGHPMFAAANFAREFATKAFLKNEGGLLGKGMSYLRRAAADPATAPIIGGLMAKEGVAALGEHLGNLPEVLSGSKVAARGSADAVSRMIGPTTGLSKAQQYDRLVAQINAAAMNPGATAQNVGGLASTFTGTSSQLAAMVAQKKLAAVQYLQQAIPKDPKGPQPFQRSEWKPTPQQKAEFLNRVEVVNNPMVVWDHYQKGSLTKADRETLQAVYPSTYNAMVQKIVQTAYDPRAPALSHAKRMQLSMFTGQPLDPSIKNLSSIQQTLAQPVQQDPAQQQPQGPKPSSRPKLHSNGLATDTSRRTYGGKVS